MKNFLTALTVLLCWNLSIESAIAAEQPAAVFPSAVVKDSNGDTVGPIVGWNGFIPMVGIADSAFPDTLVPIEVTHPDRLRGPSSNVYFQNTGCSGTVRLDPVLVADNRNGFPTLALRTYGAAYDSSGKLKIYRSTSTTATITAYNSKFNPFQNSGACEGTSSSANSVPATQILDMTILNPPPYSIN